MQQGSLLGPLEREVTLPASGNSLSPHPVHLHGFLGELASVCSIVFGGPICALRWTATPRACEKVLFIVSLSGALVQFLAARPASNVEIGNSLRHCPDHDTAYALTAREVGFQL